MATHSSVLAWRIPRMGEPGRLPSMGSHRVGHDWSDLAAIAGSLMTSLHGQSARLIQSEQGATKHLFLSLPSPKDVFSEANHTTHGAKITTISLTSSVDAFANFITPIGKISDPFLCVLTSHSSVSGTLKLITSLFTCLLLLPSRTSVLPTHPVLPVPCRMIGSS